MRNVVFRCKKIIAIAAVLGIVHCAADSGFAVPAAPGVHDLNQKDGKKVKARQWGDESQHGWQTEDGYTIVFDGPLGSWTYAVVGPDGGLVSSGRVAGKDAVPSELTRKVRPSAQFRSALPKKRLARESSPGALPDAKDAAATGTFIQHVVSPAGDANLLVILVNFNDTATTYSGADFNTLLFGTGSYSMKDYYQEVSYGAFSVSAGPGGIAGWYTASNTHDYYGANNLLGNDRWPGTLVREAVAAADAAGYNFAAYDQDGDCYVDVVNIVHQGSGEEAGGPSTDIWSHRWDLNSADMSGYSNGGEYSTDDVCAANPAVKVKVNDYVIQPERLLGGLQTVGVFAHEYGHALGLPDLYDTDGSSEGIGDWSIMAGGSWNEAARPGDRPAHPDAWSKFFLNWVTPTVVTGTLTNESVSAVETEPEVYQLRGGTPSAGEYYLVENRQLTGFDAGLPGAGLLIWHVDGANISKKMSSNSVNNAECYPPSDCSSKHFGVALVQADNEWSLEKGTNRGNAGDPFSSLTNASFTDTTAPNSNLYNGSPSGVSVTEISPSGAVMTARFSVSSSRVDTFNNNVTMLDSGNQVQGGSNDVHFTWDRTLKTSVAASGQVANASLSSVCSFGSVWGVAHEVAMYGPGTYTVYSGCPAGSPGCGTGTPITFTVAPGEMGGHMLVDRISSKDKDVVNVWTPKAVFGPSLMWTGTCGANPAETVWDWMSKDWNEDGINGFPMVDALFAGYNVNFNLMGISSEAIASSKIGVVRGNSWFLDMNGNGGWDDGIDAAYSFGIPGDVPITGDWNGSGATKIGVVRGNTWFLDMNGNGTWDGPDLAYSFGVPGEVPITGDWNNSGTTKIGVVRGNTWFLDMNGNGGWDDGIDAAYSFGVPGDVPITGDWDGNGTTKIGVVRGNTWFLDMNGNGGWDDGVDAAYSFGVPGDVPIIGDWDASGATNLGVVRGNTWFLDMNGNGEWDDGIDAAYSFGVPGDISVTGKW